MTDEAKAEPDWDAWRTEVAARAEAVRAALRHYGNMPLPLDAQLKMGELYADFGMIADAIEQGQHLQEQSR